MKKPNYYQMLGISNNATLAEIKKAYRKVAMKYHPDKNPGNRWAEDKFKNLTEAYGVLSSADERRKYDAEFNGGPYRSKPSAKSTNYNDIFTDLFKNSSAQTNSHQRSTQQNSQTQTTAKPRQGRDIHADLKVSFAESIMGAEKTVEVRRTEICESCKGTGAKHESLRSICPKCLGSGESSSRFSENGNCSRCRGLGYIIHQNCTTCKGSAVVERERSIKVKIPSPIENGASLRLAKQGHCGINGGRAGDVLVRINVEPHAVLERDGTSLKCCLPINFSMAALGGEIRVPTLGGSVRLEIPSGTQSGQIFRLKNLGVPKTDGKSGDLFATVTVRVPKELNRRQQKLIKDLAKYEPDLD